MPPSEPLDPPSTALLVREGLAWLEFAGLLPAVPILRAAPRGDGHPVLVFPGYLANDTSTRALRWFLRDRGYHAHGWRLGRNLGPSHETVHGVARRLREVHERHDRPVTLLGWSLGGIYARELARHFPDVVRQVITLASPFRDVSATSVTRLARLGIGPRPAPPDPALAARLGEPLPVPSTSIFSRLDGIVAWQSCLQEAGPRSENVEVRSTHCGMGHHAAALLVIADRLAQLEGTWAPFVSSGFSRWPLLQASIP